MILLFTDFGYEGPYVGLLHTMLTARAPGVPVIDLMHDAPTFRPREAGVLLEALVSWMPPRSIVVGVVDPGVGSERAALLARAGDRWFIGPDNGLFAPLLESEEVRVWQLPIAESAAPSFHGRDVFAPAAAVLSCGVMPRGIRRARTWVGRGERCMRSRVVYVDGFGNVMLGVRADALAEGEGPRFDGSPLPRARTFADRPSGDAFWYENSLGLVEVAVNRGSAARRFGLEVGKTVPLG